MLFLTVSRMPGHAERATPSRAWRQMGAAALCCLAVTTSIVAIAQQAKTTPLGVPVVVAEKQPRTTAYARPLWKELSASQQQALLPLAPHWDSLNSAHKRKWLALSRNHNKLSPAEQAKLHSRMSDWAGLSQQERAQARFNFAEVKQIPSDERKAKWEAYQALSDKEKRALAEGATPRTPGATATARPVSTQKLAPIPAGASTTPHTARIELVPPPATRVPVPESASAAESSSAATITAPSPTVAPSPARTPPVPVTEQPSSAP